MWLWRWLGDGWQKPLRGGLQLTEKGMLNTGRPKDGMAWGSSRITGTEVLEEDGSCMGVWWEILASDPC